MKHECKEHCPCYLAIQKDKRKLMEDLNEKRTTEQRSEAAKKGWSKRKDE